MAGLSLMPTEGEAATYMEATDFGGNFNAATDLTSTFSNFLNDSIITGSIQPVETDTLDFFRVNVAPNTATSIPFSVFSTIGNSAFGFDVYNSGGNYIWNGYTGLMVSADTTYEGVISFMTPADGIVIFGTSYESGPATINYSIGAVPEPTSALLAAAGIAASALVRRRNRA